VIELGEKFGKTCTYALLVVMLAGVVAMATNNSFALAQQPCQVQLGSPNASTQQYYYSGSNLQLTLPVSASCSFYAGQLYATGSAYDTTYQTYVGTTQAVLTSTYGGYGYTGQLTFTIPTSALGHSVQFSVSIYRSQNGYYGGYYGASLLAQTTSTFEIAPGYYQSYPTYPSYPSSPNYPAYPSYPSYPTYPSSPTYPTYPSYSNYPGSYQGPNYNWYYYHNGNYHHQYYCRPWNYKNYCYWPHP